ncbi:MAG: hypothetical protein AMXMBFR33_18620 [Candidatus Xenobia bacterium]|jgi:voltage-gated potassium channel
MTVRERARRITEHPAFDLTVMALILASVALLAAELVSPPGSSANRTVRTLSDAILWLFVVELTLRYLAMRRRRRFVQEYFFDLLALLPIIPIFRVLRLFRLFRLFRLIRMTSLLHSNSRTFGLLLHRRAAEHMLLFFLILFAVTFGTLGMEMFENLQHHNTGTLMQAFWTTVFSLFAGEYVNQYPATLGGKLIILCVIFAGLGFFAVLTGTVAAVMVEKLKEGAAVARMMFEEMEDHCVVCGWNSGVESMLMELQSHPGFRNRDVVVITERDELPEMRGLPSRQRVRLLRDDFTRVEVLQRVNITRAKVAIIVSDTGMSRTRQDADARTVLAALTIEKLNPSIYTCAELSNAMNEHHLRMGNVNQVVITREVSGHLLAQAALDEAHLSVLHDLLRPGTGTTLATFPVDTEDVGKTFTELLSDYRKRTGYLPLAVKSAGSGEVVINPEERRLNAGDMLVCVDSESTR